MGGSSSVRLKIGALAEATGLTVRTLHHWDAIGLLHPGGRTGGGHREYTDDDVGRLYRILALRQIGLGLDAIRECLDGDGDVDLSDVVADHLAAVESSIAALTALVERLRRIEAELGGSGGGGRPSVPTLVAAIRAIDAARPGRSAALAARLDPGQLRSLQDAAHEAGPAAEFLLEVEWPRLYAAAESLRAAGADPSADDVQQVVRRMDQLSALFSGGDPALAQGVRDAWRDEPVAMSGDATAVEKGYSELARFIERARAVPPPSGGDP